MSLRDRLRSSTSSGDEDDLRFMEWLMREISTDTARGPNGEARALFNTIQLAYTDNPPEVEDYTPIPVAPFLVANLAACAWVALDYDRGENIHGMRATTIHPGETPQGS